MKFSSPQIGRTMVTAGACGGGAQAIGRPARAQHRDGDTAEMHGAGEDEKG